MTAVTTPAGQVAPLISAYVFERIVDASCVSMWIFLSATMVFYNKFLLSYFGTGAKIGPITLTLWHMVVCTTLASICVLSGLVKPLDIPSELYIKKILPIATCYAGALWTSNAAYAISSVSFAQMIKSGMPVAVFITGIVFGTERFRWVLLADILLVTMGVTISAYGEAHLVVLGLILLLLSLAFEAIRLTLTQQMIQSSGLRFNPITTLYYIAPVASGFLSIPFVLLEAKDASTFVSSASEGLWHFVLNGLNAFALNLAVFLLLGRTSALTMNICGLVKDWFTIAGSVLIFGSIVTVTNLVGYIIAFAGVLWYNYLRMPRPVSDAAATVMVSGSGAGAGEKGAEKAADKMATGAGGSYSQGGDAEEQKPLLLSSSRMALEVDPGPGAKGGSPERPLPPTTMTQTKGTFARLLGV